jgi:hypothetical protein
MTCLALLQETKGFVLIAHFWQLLLWDRFALTSPDPADTLDEIRLPAERADRVKSGLTACFCVTPV